MSTIITPQRGFLIHSLPEESLPEDHVIGSYYIKASGVSVLKAAEEVAMECSTGTWTNVKYQTPEVDAKYGGKILNIIDLGGGKAIVRIAFPAVNYDPTYGSVEGILTGIAGNVFDMAVLDAVRLVDIEFPRSFAEAFPGPQHGAEGCRQRVGLSGSRRPMVGAIIKPNLGLDAKQLANMCHELTLGGLDLIKDDEDLIDPPYCRLHDRVVAVYEAVDRAKSQTGKETLYAVNVTARPDRVVELGEKAVEAGSRCLMVDMAWIGPSSIRALAEDASTRKVPLHVHWAGHGAYTRSEEFGLSELVVSKISRLCGADQFHQGTVGGKFVEHISDKKRNVAALMGKWLHLNPTMPNASAAIHPGNIELNVAVMGWNIQLTAGGGIHGHPSGLTAGA
ncbi:MAG: RuBisCO large subunit C-terminal-like domain-containing protein, partial [Candidatus Bathyarchaeia archaeon]